MSLDEDTVAIKVERKNNTAKSIMIISAIE
jgi:hypothetical protein